VKSTPLLLIRHAESTWNASERWQGHGDPPLSSRGRDQAHALARELASEAVDVLVCSDLRRAVETAEILGKAWGLAPEPVRALRELDVGSWTGLPREEIEERDSKRLARFESGEPDLRPGGGESRAEIRLRVRAALTELVEAHPGERIAVVAHLGVIRALQPGSEPANTELIGTSLEALRASWPLG